MVSSVMARPRPNRLGASCYVIQPSNAPDYLKSQAYEVCEASSDEDVINSVLNTIAAAGNPKAEVKLGAGLFYFSDSVLIPVTPTVLNIRGSGRGVTYIYPDGTLTKSFFKEKVQTNRIMHLTMSDFTIDGDDGGSNTQTAGHGIHLWGASYCTLKQIEVYDPFDTGIYFNGDGTYTGVDCEVIDCLMSGCITGLVTQTNQGDLSITDCKIFGNSTAGLGLYGGGPIIIGNRIYTNTTYGIYTNGYPNLIHDNYISSSATGIRIDNNWPNIQGNTINLCTTGITLDATVTQGIVAKNDIVGATTPISNAGSIKPRFNSGHITENYGTSSITSGNTTKTVAHGCSATPTKINIEFREQGTNDYGRWWISGIDGTNFILNVTGDPGASNLDFAWEALVR